MKEKLAAMADERSASLTDWHGTNTVVTPEDCGYTGGFAAEAIQQVIVLLHVIGTHNQTTKCYELLIICSEVYMLSFRHSVVLPIPSLFAVEDWFMLSS